MLRLHDFCFAFLNGRHVRVFLQLLWQPPKIREQSGIIAPIMDCPEKEALQTKCSAAWEAYDAEAKKAGLRAENRFPVPRSVSELIRVGFHLDPRTRPVFSQANSTAMFLRREYLKALWDLSKHLSNHRC